MRIYQQEVNCLEVVVVVAVIAKLVRELVRQPAVALVAGPARATGFAP